jgi:acetolactate synthase I/II/III large subunit
MTQKLSDYVFDFLKKKGVDIGFSVSGGAAAHLLDSSKKNDFKLIPNYHEQASAMCAEGFARITNRPALVLVTNGPGSSNTITGVVGAYQDSIPMIIISGQVPTRQTLQPGLRQLGVQELDIISIIKSITKYSIQVRNKDDIKFHLEKAYYLTNNGRKGPVWLDIPLDIQASFINVKKLRNFTPEKNRVPETNFSEIIKMISEANQPLIICGNGIHISETENDIKVLIQMLQIPFVCTWTAKDIFSSRNELNIGNFGIMGERAANFAVQNADLLLILGSRLSIPNTGYNTSEFSPKSKKIMVDIDINEMNKSTLEIDYKINLNLKEFFPKFINQLSDNQISSPVKWIKKTKSWKNKYPVYQEEYKLAKDHINSYHFIEVLSSYLKENHVIVTDMGTSYTCTHQALKTNGNNRLYTSSATCSMGFGLPGAIGSIIGDDSKEVILISGDGGFQMNIQELQTVVQHNLPIKIFILNNNGYLAISLMQDNLFASDYVGSTPESGVSSPDFCEIGKAYGIKTFRLSNNQQLSNSIEELMEMKGPFICEIIMPPNQLLIPRVQSMKDKEGNIISPSLDIMFPFLSENEVKNIN